MHMDRRTDMTKLIVDFKNIANALKNIGGSLMRFITSVYSILYIPEQENTYDMKVIEAERIFCRMLQRFKGISIKSVLVYLNMPGSLALVLPLAILHLCGAKSALTDTLSFISCSVSSYTVNDKSEKAFLPIPLASRS